MKLFYSPSACSLSPHIVFREAGLDIALEKVDLRAHRTAGGQDFYVINPKGYVPALQLDDGSLLTEGPAIVQYLADLKPQSGLAPANGTLDRYRLQEWLNYISTEFHKSFSPLFNPTTPAEARQAQMTVISNRLDFLARALEGKSYLMGNTFTVADAYLFTVLSWTPFVKIDLASWPALKEYHSRIALRPAVQKALEAEGVKK